MSLNQYQVGDLILDAKALNVLMILESPHVNEIIHQHPAAGESALALTQLLLSQGYVQDFNADTPVGCNIKALHYTPLGILNCSHLPLSANTYPCDLSKATRTEVNNLSAIKTQLATNPANTIKVLTDSNVFQDFVSRLTAIVDINPNVTIIPCGQTAKGFIRAFSDQYNKPLNIAGYLPHPTESAWQDAASIDLRAMVEPQMLP